VEKGTSIKRNSIERENNDTSINLRKIFDID
jgi:hypothetical protein